VERGEPRRVKGRYQSYCSPPLPPAHIVMISLSVCRRKNKLEREEVMGFSSRATSAFQRGATSGGNQTLVDGDKRRKEKQRSRSEELKIWGGQFLPQIRRCSFARKCPPF